MDDSFPFQEYQSKLKENLFLDTKFSFDFERILAQITEFKNTIMQANSPIKLTSKKEESSATLKRRISTEESVTKKEKEDTPKKEENLRKEEKKDVLSGVSSNTQKKNDETQAKKADDSTKKSDDVNKKSEEVNKKADEITKKSTEKPKNVSSPKDAIPQKKPSKEIRKYLTPTKERLKNSSIFIDDTFVDPPKESNPNPIVVEKDPPLIPNQKSQSAKNADNKVIMFMIGDQKWSKLNAGSEKKPVKKIITSGISGQKGGKLVKNGITTKKNESKEVKRVEAEKKEKSSELFQEKISEIFCVANENSECLTPVKLLKELAQIKNLTSEKSITSEFGNSFILKNLSTEEEKNLIKMSSKLKEKFKQDYNLDIDLIEKETRNSAMQTPNFGTNHALQVLKHAKNLTQMGQNGNLDRNQNGERNKKMEQINEMSSPKDEKQGQFECVERIYHPILKKNGKTMK